MVTSGSVTKKIECEMMVAGILPYMPTVTQKARNPRAVITGGSMNGATPSVNRARA